MGSKAQLMVLTGELAGKRFDVPAHGLRVGRSSSNDVHIPDEELSRNHCLFEREGETALRVIDLASANGTFVNSVALGSDACILKPGDVIEAGKTVLKVVDEDTPATVTLPPHVEAPAAIIAPGANHAESAPAPAGPVDLGLGGVRGSDIVAGASGASGGAQHHPSIANILWGIVAISVISAIALILLFPASQPDAPRSQTTVVQQATPGNVTEVYYEKIESDTKHIFRYEMSVAQDGTLRVVYDDVPEENRHIDKSAKLDQRAMARIAEIFSDEEWNAIDDNAAFTGSSAVDENALRSWRIRTIGGTRVRDILVENSPEPASFRRVREALETFSRNELGVWALQYSRDKLLELSRDAERLGDAKWSERDVEYGNTASAAASYKEALFYLETVNPKPENYTALREKHEQVLAELDKRYRDQRFLVDRAIGLGDWQTAKTELTTLMDLVPDAGDERHKEAEAKLLDVERRLSSAKRKGGKK